MAARSAIRSGTVPGHLSSFVGRAQEVAALAELVQRSRLTTLTGAGGVALAWILRERAGRTRPARGWGSLTPAELSVVRLVAQGLPNPEIAARLFISRRTVTTHLTHVFAKLDVSTRAELAAAAVRQELG